MTMVLRNLKAQCRLYASGAGSILLLLAIFIPYSFILGSAYESEVARSYTYQIEVFILIPVMLLLFMIMWSGVIGGMALGYGTTRRGWFAGQFVLKLAASAVFCSLGLLVFIPLAKLVFGEPLAFQTGLLLPFFALTWGLSAMGEFLGYVIGSKGARWMFIVLGPIVLLIIFAVFFAISNEWVFLVTSTGVTIIGLAMVVLFQPLAWLVLRRMAVRG